MEPLPDAGRGPAADEVVLAAVAAGKPHAFDVLVARWGPRVAAYLRHVVGEPAWVEDLTQEVFVKVHDHLHERESGASFAVWLFRIARNTALDFERRRQLHVRALESARKGRGPLARLLVQRRPPTPLAMLESREFSVALELALAELPEPQRTVFLLREHEGLSYEEIAAVVGCPAKTVSTRLARARTCLRKQLAAYLEGPRTP
ncbi:MAG: sigma-70 family RNA polymerase sigma factor [bacterium]|nr:sigma-70 family RNA polymerase sigma factor [bacterium]